jgi:hypothetical protein
MSAKRFNSHTPGLQVETDLGFDDTFVGPVLEHGFDAAGASGSGGGGKLKTYTSGDPSIPDSQEFNIQINFSGKWTAEQQADAIAAANAWSRIITGDIHDDTDLKGHLVDDIVIDLRIGRIDGLGGVDTGVNTLATTGNWVVRDAGTQDQLLPLTASIRLDVADLQNPDLASLWPAIIMHEMGHALGFFGGLFQAFNLLDPVTHSFFTGINAVDAYGGAVPLSSDFSHWSETSFSPKGAPMPEDLMTTLFSAGQHTMLSDTTVAAFADLGYAVDDPSPGIAFIMLDTWLV